MTSQKPRINVPTTASVMVREHVLLLVGAKESQDPEKNKDKFVSELFAYFPNEIKR